MLFLSVILGNGKSINVHCAHSRMEVCNKQFFYRNQNSTEIYQINCGILNVTSVYKENDREYVWIVYFRSIGYSHVWLGMAFFQNVPEKLE